MDKDTIKKIESLHKVSINKLIPFLISSKSRFDQIDKNILINLLNNKLASDIKNKLDPGKPVFENCKILSANIIRDLFNNNI